MNTNLFDAFWMIGEVSLLALFTLFRNPVQHTTPERISFSRLLNGANQGRVRDVLVHGLDIHGIFTEGRTFWTYATKAPAIVHKLYSKKVSVTARQLSDNVRWFVSVLVPFIIAFIGVWSFVFRQPQIVTGEALSFGKSRANLLSEVNGRVTFVDVADAEETKQDLQETVEFLRELVRFPPLVGRFPRGGVRFYSSDSDVVELFGGIWPLSVGDMFEQTKKDRSCIIFTDKVDSIGRHRIDGLGGGHHEREQTLDQLLAEIVGANIIIVPIAVNREHMLRKVPLASDVNLKAIARGTPGVSDLDLLNLVNETAPVAAQRNERMRNIGVSPSSSPISGFSRRASSNMKPCCARRLRGCSTATRQYVGTRELSRALSSAVRYAGEARTLPDPGRPAAKFDLQIGCFSHDLSKHPI